ncbi:MAG: transposase [Pyrinomonadaceae bacterium]
MPVASYENLLPDQPCALMKRFEFHYPPKKGSWLNMAELEWSAISRQCLARRIADIETLSRELEIIVKERNDLEIKVKWQFTVDQARTKLSRHYKAVMTKN